MTAMPIPLYNAISWMLCVPMLLLGLFASAVLRLCAWAPPRMPLWAIRLRGTCLTRWNQAAYARRTRAKPWLSHVAAR